jgi:hypothetical protein
MRDSYPVAAVRAAAVSTFTNQYVRRLLVALLLTGFDGSVLLTAGRDVYEAASLMPWLVFGVLVVGLLFTLGRVWLLTFRVRRSLPELSHNPNPEERSFP